MMQKSGGVWRNAKAIDELEDVIALMSEDYMRKAPARMLDLARLAASLEIATDPLDTIQRVVREAHMIKGSAGTLGLHELSRLAGEVERLARLGTPAGWPSDMQGALSALRAAADRFPHSQAA